MNNANEVSQSITYKLLIFVAHFSQKKIKNFTRFSHFMFLLIKANSSLFVQDFDISKW